MSGDRCDDSYDMSEAVNGHKSQLYYVPLDPINTDRIHVSLPFSSLYVTMMLQDDLEPLKVIKKKKKKFMRHKYQLTVDVPEKSKDRSLGDTYDVFPFSFFFIFFFFSIAKRKIASLFVFVFVDVLPKFSLLLDFDLSKYLPLLVFNPRKNELTDPN